jgi:hypothetical protein
MKSKSKLALQIVGFFVVALMAVSYLYNQWRKQQAFDKFVEISQSLDEKLSLYDTKWERSYRAVVLHKNDNQALYAKAEALYRHVNNTIHFLDSLKVLIYPDADDTSLYHKSLPASFAGKELKDAIRNHLDRVCNSASVAVTSDSARTAVDEVKKTINKTVTEDGWLELECTFRPAYVTELYKLKIDISKIGEIAMQDMNKALK